MESFKTKYFEQLTLIPRTNLNLNFKPTYEKYYNDSARTEIRVYNIKPELSKFINSNFLLTTSDTMDISWFTKSRDYVDELSPVDIVILSGYATYGDNIVNTYLRFGKEKTRELPYFKELYNNKFPHSIQVLRKKGIDPMPLIEKKWIDKYHRLNNKGITILKEILPTLSDEEIFECIEEFIQDLRRIIINSPRPNKPLRVFRGVQTDYLSESDRTVMKGFISTTIDAKETLINFYQKNGQEGYVYDIILTPNTPCIVMEYVSHHGEYEILVIDNTPFSVSKLDIKLEFNPNQLNLLNPFDPQELKTFVTRNLIALDGNTNMKEGGQTPQKKYRGRSTRKKHRV